jgi:hypothetical protein
MLKNYSNIGPIVMKSSQKDGKYIKFERYVSFVSRIFNDSCTELVDPADPFPEGCKKTWAKCIEQRCVKFV